MQVSAIQTDVDFGEPDANLAVLQKHVETEAREGSRLVVFPECFLAGYCCASKEEAQQISQPVDGPFVSAVVEECHRHNAFVVFGMVESSGEGLFNTSVLAGPDGVVGTYRKVHLPWLGVDRFVQHGNRPFAVHEIDGLRVGMLICYDGGFPEAVRCLSLDGADLVVLPTNWPPGAEQLAEYAGNSRALENSIYFLAANRVGEERGFRFIGRSRICDPTGRTLDSADHAEECVLRAEIDVDRARTKRITRVPGQHVIDRVADRRPEMYARICEPHSLPRPGRDDDA